MRAKYKLSQERRSHTFEGIAGQVTEDVHAILCLFVSYAIWTMHAFKIGITLGVLAMQIARNAD
jgi:hypothetical protein